MPQKVYNLIILDASGSMESIREQARTGVNETIQTIKKAMEENPEQTHFVTFASFNSNGINVVYDRVLASKVVELKRDDYRPNACTPLYDAIGTTVTNLKDYVEKGDVVLVTIITDGYENSSKEFSQPMISRMIADLRKQDWVFTYIGANQDVEREARKMNINNSMKFEASVEGIKDMFLKERESRMCFCLKANKASKGEIDRAELQDNYFVDDDSDD